MLSVMYHVTYIIKEYLNFRDTFIEWPNFFALGFFLCSEVFISILQTSLLFYTYASIREVELILFTFFSITKERNYIPTIL